MARIGRVHVRVAVARAKGRAPAVKTAHGAHGLKAAKGRRNGRILAVSRKF